jgi:hypothetical protein
LAFCFVPQNAIDVELCLRLTTGKPALAPWKGDVETRLAKCKLLGPLLAATELNQL